MSEKLQPITIRGLDRGMTDSSVVADAMMPQRQMRLIQNMDTDVIGNLTSRKGYTLLGSDAVVSSKTGLGLHHHVSSNSSYSQIIAFCNNSGDTGVESHYLSSGTWTSKSMSFTAGIKVRAVTFLDYVIAVNGTDSPKSWTGNASDVWGTTQLASAPTSHLIETYKQQVFMGNTSTDRIDFSSVPSSGVITWPTNNNFIVNPNDGANLTALKRYAGQLLIFKSNYTYRFNGQSVDPDPVIFYGASSQDAVTESAGTCWFFDGKRHAILAYRGGFPQEISKPVRAFLEAIPTSYYTSVILRSDNDHVEAFIGNVTVDGVSFTDTALRYVISTQTWVIRTYANTFNVATDYDDGTTIYRLQFADNGKVYKMDNGFTDDSTAISYQAETSWLVLGGDPTNEIKLAGFAVFADPHLGTAVQYKTERDKTWRSVGKMTDYVTVWNGINTNFHKIKFRFIGSASASQAQIEGFAFQVPIYNEKEESTNKLI